MSAPRPPSYSDIEARARAAAAKALPQGLDHAARAAITEAHDFLAEVDRALDLSKPLAAIACGPGCAHCCHQMVSVTVAERDLLRNAIAALPASQRQAVQARAREVAGKAEGLNQAQYWAAKLPCPLLDENGACAVHQARPLPCRAMNSADADTCRRSFAGEQSLRIPILAAQHRIFGHAQIGLAQALLAAGHSGAGHVLALELVP